MPITSGLKKHSGLEGRSLCWRGRIGGRIIHGRTMLTRIQGVYLRDEQKYDRWGALGKVLATLEVLRAAGVGAGSVNLEKVVNAAFPRTFSCQRVPGSDETLPPPELLRREVASMAGLLRDWGIAPLRAESLAIEEVGERRCLDAGFLREYLKT
jgi:hypothetical protein